MNDIMCVFRIFRNEYVTIVGGNYVFLVVYCQISFLILMSHVINFLPTITKCSILISSLSILTHIYTIQDLIC
jgi:hypothetical protein